MKQNGYIAIKNHNLAGSIKMPNTINQNKTCMLNNDNIRLTV